MPPESVELERPCQRKNYIGPVRKLDVQRGRREAWHQHHLIACSFDGRDYHAAHANVVEHRLGPLIYSS